MKKAESRLSKPGKTGSSDETISDTGNGITSFRNAISTDFYRQK
jgi:hypothetical protein